MWYWIGRVDFCFFNDSIPNHFTETIRGIHINVIFSGNTMGMYKINILSKKLKLFEKLKHLIRSYHAPGYRKFIATNNSISTKSPINPMFLYTLSILLYCIYCIYNGDNLHYYQNSLTIILPNEFHSHYPLIFRIHPFKFPSNLFGDVFGSTPLIRVFMTPYQICRKREF